MSPRWVTDALMQHASYTMASDFEAAGDAAAAGRSALSALILEPALPDALFAVETLSAAGFHVTVAETFAEAKALLSSRRPSLLLTEIRLGDYNGLQLVMHAKAIEPSVASIVTARRRDPVLEAEAERMDATFVLKPTTASELRAAVWRTLLRAPDDITLIRPPFERRTLDRRLHPQRYPPREERRTAERRLGAARLPRPSDESGP